MQYNVWAIPERADRSHYGIQRGTLFPVSFLSFPDTGFKEGCRLVGDFQIEEMWN